MPGLVVRIHPGLCPYEGRRRPRRPRPDLRSTAAATGHPQERFRSARMTYVAGDWILSSAAASPPWICAHRRPAVAWVEADRSQADPAGPRTGPEVALDQVAWLTRLRRARLAGRARPWSGTVSDQSGSRSSRERRRRDLSGHASQSRTPGSGDHDGRSAAIRSSSDASVDSRRSIDARRIARIRPSCPGRLVRAQSSIDAPRWCPAWLTCHGMVAESPRGRVPLHHDTRASVGAGGHRCRTAAYAHVAVVAARVLGAPAGQPLGASPATGRLVE